MTEIKNKGYSGAVATDIEWAICVVSCKFEFSPTSGQDTLERHLWASHYIKIEEVRVSEGDDTKVNTFDPI